MKNKKKSTANRAVGLAVRFGVEALEGRLHLSATTLVVNTTIDQVDDSGGGTISLRDAINIANADAADDTIVVQSGSTYGLSLGQLEINKPQGSLAIEPDGDTPATIDAQSNVGGANENNPFRVFQVDAGSNASLSRLIITNGSAVNGDRGGGIYNSGTLDIANSTITGDTVIGDSAYGGGLYNAFASSLTVSDSTFSNDTANGPQAGGGGIVNNDAALTITDSTFSGDSAISPRGCGGGIYNERDPYSGGPDISVTHCVFTDDSAALGGGINNSGQDETFTLADSTFTGDTAGDLGGGFLNNYQATVTNCTFSGDSAVNGGGGLFNGQPANARDDTLTVIGSTFSNDSSHAGGGMSDEGTLIVDNSTWSGDNATANGGGGALQIDPRHTATLTNCTISGNSSVDPGGGISNYGTATLDNTIVAGNTLADNTTPSDIVNETSGPLLGSVSGSYNLIGAGGSGGVANGVNGDAGNIFLSPGGPSAGLVPLADNGGPTLTLALLPSSPAIDTGSNALAVDQNGNPLGNDQRGAPFPRIFNGTVDIGAYESQATILPPSISPQSLTIHAKPKSGSPVGSIAATDAQGRALSYSLSDVSGSVAAFAIDSHGLLTIADPTALPAIPAGSNSVSLTFNVTVTDTPENLSATALITIQLNRTQLEAPIFSSPVITLTDLGAAVNSAGATIGTVVASRAYNGQVVVYTVTPSGANPPAAGLFTIDGAGVISTTAPLPAGTTYTFTVTAADTAAVGAPSASAGVTLNVVPAIVADAGANKTVNDTGSVNPFSAVTIAADSTDGATATGITVDVAVDPAYGTFADPASLGTAIFAPGDTAGAYTFTGTLAAALAATKQLRFSPIPHQIAPGLTYQVPPMSISVTDNVIGGTATAPTLPTVTVTAVDTPPGFPGVKKPQTIVTGQTCMPFQDASGNGAVVTDVDTSSTTFGVFTPEFERFIFQVSEPLIIGISFPRASFPIAAAGFGKYMFQTTAAKATLFLDGISLYAPDLGTIPSGSIATETVTVTVTQIATGAQATGTSVVNIKPEGRLSGLSASLTSSGLIATGTPAVVATSTSVVTLAGIDPVDADVLTYALAAGTGNTDNGKFMIGTAAAGTDNQLLVKAAAGLKVGTYSVRVKVSDAGGDSAAQALIITIGPTSCSVSLAGDPVIVVG